MLLFIPTPLARLYWTFILRTLFVSAVNLESRSLLHRLIMRSKIQSLLMTFFIWISNFSQFGWSKNRKHHQNVCFPTVWVSMINNNCWLGFSEALPLSLSLAHHFLWALMSAPTERPLSAITDNNPANAIFPGTSNICNKSANQSIVAIKENVHLGLKKCLLHWDLICVTDTWCVSPILLSVTT